MTFAQDKGWLSQHARYCSHFPPYFSIPWGLKIEKKRKERKKQKKDK